MTVLSFILMTRRKLQKIAYMRRREALALLKKGLFSGCYYLSGYVVECGLKACIAKKVKKHEFPDKETVNQSYTHDLIQLLGIAGLEMKFKEKALRSKQFEVNWTTIKDWNENSRYEIINEKKAKDMYKALINRKDGVLQWIKLYW